MWLAIESGRGEYAQSIALRNTALPIAASIVAAIAASVASNALRARSATRLAPRDDDPSVVKPHSRTLGQIVWMPGLKCSDCEDLLELFYFCVVKVYQTEVRS